MENPGCRQRHDIQQFIELLPGQRLFTAAPIEPELPAASGKVQYRLHRPHVAAHAKVLVVPPKLRAQYPVLLRQVQVPVVPTPNPQGLRRLPDFLARRFAFDYPIAVPRSRPVVGESDIIECVVPTTDLCVGGRFPERK